MCNLGVASIQESVSLPSKTKIAQERWVFGTRGWLEQLTTRYVGNHGAPSLAATASRASAYSLLTNAIDTETLRRCAWEPLGRQIYRTLHQMDLLNFHAWRTFWAAYRTELLAETETLPNDEGHVGSRESTISDESRPGRHHAIYRKHDSCDLAHTRSHLDVSPSLFLTNLFLGDVIVDRQALISLPTMQNLAVVWCHDVRHPVGLNQSQPLDSSIIRAWSSQAQHSGGFPSLKVLCVDDRARNLSHLRNDDLFQLATIPTLQLFTIVPLVHAWAKSAKETPSPPRLPRPKGWRLDRLRSEKPLNGVLTRKHMLRALLAALFDAAQTPDEEKSDVIKNEEAALNYKIAMLRGWHEQRFPDAEHNGTTTPDRVTELHEDQTTNLSSAGAPTGVEALVTVSYLHYSDQVSYSGRLDAVTSCCWLRRDETAEIPGPPTAKVGRPAPSDPADRQRQPQMKKQKRDLTDLLNSFG